MAKQQKDRLVRQRKMKVVQCLSLGPQFAMESQQHLDVLLSVFWLYPFPYLVEFLAALLLLSVFWLYPFTYFVVLLAALLLLDILLVDLFVLQLILLQKHTQKYIKLLFYYFAICILKAFMDYINSQYLEIYPHLNCQYPHLKCHYPHWYLRLN